jgi:lysophospholipase L1-like esterase
MTKPRWSDVAAIVVATAILAGLAFVLRPQHTPTLTVAPSTARVERPQPPPPVGPSVLFVSDAYTGGVGLKELYYGCTAALRMGWQCELSAEPGTGYISGGDANRFVNPDIGPSTSFDERLPKLADTYKPDIVVLDGGRSDLFAPTDDEFAVMTATIQTVHQIWPAARIVFIRPRTLDRPNDDLGFNDDFIARLRADPVAKDVVIVDPIRRFADTDTSALLAPDRSHPNQDGAAALSSALVDELSANGFTVAAS